MNERLAYAKEFNALLGDRQEVLTAMRGKLHGWTLEPELKLTDKFLAILDISRGRFRTLCARLGELEVPALNKPGFLSQEAWISSIITR